MRITFVSAAVFLLASAPAFAGFQQWSVETEEDPFSGGKSMTVTFMSSLRSGIVVFCDTAKTGLSVRAIPGFAYSSALDDAEPELEFAFDGSRVLGQSGSTGSVGDSLAASEVQLSPENSQLFVDAFARAKKQIAIKDGISDRPQLLSARGSTKAGTALVECMKAQKE